MINEEEQLKKSQGDIARMIKQHVEHPSHYNKPGKKECIKEMEDIFGADWVSIFCMLNSFKYVYRCGGKEDNPEEQEMAKSNWYLEYAKGLVDAGKVTPEVARKLFDFIPMVKNIV